MFNRVQFIAYELNTLPDMDNSRYLGDDNVDKDIRKRCTLMKSAMKTAYNMGSVVRSPSTLKVFMAPEFYFRNTAGAYPIDKVSMVMDELRPLADQKQFEDWLFVFGTAIGMLEEAPGQTEIFNVAFVKKGGVGNGKDVGLRECIVYKEYISSIDFLGVADHDAWWTQDGSGRKIQIQGNQGQVVRPTMGSRDLLSQGQNLPSTRQWVLNKKKEWKTRNISEVNKSGLGGGSIFTMSGVTFGLETCLDHACQRLANYRHFRGEPLVQIQLIPSCGMEIMPDSVAVMPRGPIFNVDGARDDSGVKMNTRRRLLEMPVLETEPVKLKGKARMLVTQKKYFAGTGRIRTYAAVDFPKARVKF